MSDSPIARYVAELARQADLLESAVQWDDVTLADKPPDFGAPPAGIPRKRHWTRQDRNRLHFEFRVPAFIELGRELPLLKHIEGMDRFRRSAGRMRTRRTWILRQLAKPERNIRAYHAAALAEAQATGLYSTLAPLLVEATLAHEDYVRSHDPDPCDPCDAREIDGRRRSAINRLRDFLPSVKLRDDPPQAGGSTGQSDTKPDTTKKIPRRLRSDRVAKAINYINTYNKRVDSGKALSLGFYAMISEHLGEPIESNAVDNLARQVRGHKDKLLPFAHFSPDKR